MEAIPRAVSGNIDIIRIDRRSSDRGVPVARVIMPSFRVECVSVIVFGITKPFHPTVYVLIP